MSLGLLLIVSRLLCEMLEVDSFPSIHNNVVDGIPESYVHYYKKFLYEIEFCKIEKGVPTDLRRSNILDVEKEEQLVINFKFEEK